jgi:hypothetical protein
MTVSTTDLLELLAKAGELDLSIFVKQDKDGDYVVKFYELYTNDFEETLVIYGENTSLPGYSTQKCDYAKEATCSFDYLMDTFVDMLSKKEQGKIRAQKRKELLTRLTDEEKDLLGLGSGID